MSRETLRARLSRLSRGAGSPAAEGTAARGTVPVDRRRRTLDPDAVERVPVGVEELLPGRVESGEHGSYFLHVKRRSEVTKDVPRHVAECLRAARGAGFVERAGVDERFVAAMDEGRSEERRVGKECRL